MPKADGKTVEQRLKERYTVDPETGCWNWTAGLNAKGYAYIWTGPRRKGDTRQAYKVAWEFKYGPVPDDKHLHHKCENRLCVNPDHLELLTHKEHQRKHPNILTTKNAMKTHCPKGHPFDEHNTYVIPGSGGRACRTCIQERAKARTKKGQVGYSL